MESDTQSVNPNLFRVFLLDVGYIEESVTGNIVDLATKLKWTHKRDKKIFVAPAMSVPENPDQCLLEVSPTFLC